MESSDITIVGGGLVGLITAHLALQANFTVSLIDLESPQISWNDEYGLRVSSVNRATVETLKELGIWTSIQQERVSPYKKMHVWDALSSGVIDFNADDVAEPYLGYIVENRVMIKHLTLQLKQYQRGDQCRIYFGDQIQSLNRQGSVWNMILGSGVVVKGDVLIAADGAKSELRERLGFKTSEMHYGQYAVVAMVKLEKPHDQTAYQVFLPTGPLALLPLSDPHLCSIVWSTDPDHAKTLVSDSDELFNEAIQQAFGDRLGKITVFSTRASFPLVARQADEYAHDGVALVGDAAHTIHPLAGQGMNLGVQDASSLIQTLVWARDCDRPLSSLGTLKRYERDRMGQNQLMLWAMQGFNGLFSNDSPLLARLRGIGLNQVNYLTPIKETLIKVASGRCRK